MIGRRGDRFRKLIKESCLPAVGRWITILFLLSSAGHAASQGPRGGRTFESQLEINQNQGLSENPQTRGEKVYPQRIHSTRSRRDLSTLLKDKVHEDSYSVRIPTKQEDIILDLKKNEQVYPSSILLRTFNDKGEAVHVQHTPHDCYYSGKVRSREDSHCHLSTCHGLTGSLDIGERKFDIEPILDDEDGGHILYDVEDHVKDLTLKLTSSHPVYRSSGEEINPNKAIQDDKFLLNRHKRGVENVLPFELKNIGKQYVKYLTTNRTRYVEMFLSADHGLYKTYKNNTDLILERVLNAVGYVDMCYQKINIRVVLVALEIQSHGPAFERVAGAGPELHHFQLYYNNVLMKHSDFKKIRIDNFALLSYKGWGAVAGMSFVGTMCTRLSAAVDHWDFWSIRGPTFVIGHELGHNLNFPHDYKGCKCLTRKGCFMTGAWSSHPGFSDCNLKHLAQKAHTCLNDYPKHPLFERCGNGIRENDEVCDCGTPENCARVDPCCKPYGCTLKAEVQCSFWKHPECCNKQCQFKKYGTMCRKASHDCDVAEFCTGEDASCPADHGKSDGSECGNNIKMLLGPLKKDEVRPTKLTPPVKARYFKILPQSWTKGGHVCMQLEMHGCAFNDSFCPPSHPHAYLNGQYCCKHNRENTDPAEGSSCDGSLIHYNSTCCLHHHYQKCPSLTSKTCRSYGESKINPTPISVPALPRQQALCLTPDVKKWKSCNEPVPDGTKLRYVRSTFGECSEPHMLFALSPDGTLIHHCSGKKVCPGSDYKLELNSKCFGDESKYRRLKEGLLQHLKSNFCVLACDGWPSPGDYVCIADACRRHDKAAVHVFQQEDYELPLGFRNGRLPTSAFTAGVNQKAGHYIRMGSKEYWCGNSWFQIDFGKTVGVKHITVKGSHWNWVTGYHLAYSDDGVSWHSYKDSSANPVKDQYCYRGKCAPSDDDQCRALWNADAKKAADSCWNQLNTIGNGFGTCNGKSHVPCEESNIFCGQLQCTSSQKYPYYVNYGKYYKTFNIDGNVCRGAMIATDVGMVKDGTKCGNGKLCIGHECKTLKEHGLKSCTSRNGVVCYGRGVCTSHGTCSCNAGYDSKDDCKTLATAVNGGWSEWSSWSQCKEACAVSKHQRYRFCNNPIPKHGGLDCPGARIEEAKCQNKCLVGRSCKDIKMKMERDNLPLFDGVYTIQPDSSLTLKVYCDMTRNGGGWTLIVSSHMNTWTSENVKLRNKESPELFNDYSILKYGDVIKENGLKAKFQYRLEASQFGSWGGVFDAPAYYSMMSTNPEMNEVRLLKKFDDWEFDVNAVGCRVPYLVNQRLTTAPPENGWGAITDSRTYITPAQWMTGALKMGKPEHIWYWLREGEPVSVTFKSCLDIMFEGFEENTLLKSGIYSIEPEEGRAVQTFCDFDRYGGGWTLLASSDSSDGWSADNILNRNAKDAGFTQYSIYGLMNRLKGNDLGELSYDYMIEAGGADRNGGIFSYDITGNPASKPTLIKKFGNWDENEENIARYPIRVFKSSVLLAANSGNSSDNAGVIIGGNNESIYMKTYKKPDSVKIWIRSGGSRRSCNDLKIHALHKGKTDHTDGFYMMKGLQSYYCDMTTTKNEGWTLVVTSASKGWKTSQVLSRNERFPSLHQDYSILGKADTIKSLSSGRFFKYMVDSKKRHHWGGIWKAPIEYSFTSRTGKQATLLRKFDNWNNGLKWWLINKEYMPYLGNPAYHKGLLTTVKFEQHCDWGSIISEGASRFPSTWMYPQSPGYIWYWINENDCDADYKKVHGGIGVSMWSACSVDCGEGIQYRETKCVNPAPRCGGDPCKASDLVREERPCTGTCRTVRIETMNRRFCLEPRNGGCNVKDLTPLVFRPTASKCKGDETRFVFNPSTGDIHHECSRKRVCFAGGRGSELIVNSKCPAPTKYKHFHRTQWHTIRIDSNALTPFHWLVQDGNRIVSWNDGKGVLQQFLFINRTTNREMEYLVSSSYFSNAKYKSIDAFQHDKRYPGLPTHRGGMDNLATPFRVGSTYGMRVKSLFTAPDTGDYVFMASCDDLCKVYLSPDTNPSAMKEIISVTYATKWYEFRGRSKFIRLVAGKQYYIEGVLLQFGGDDHMEIGVTLPGGRTLEPITHHYLSNRINE